MFSIILASTVKTVTFDPTQYNTTMMSNDFYVYSRIVKVNHICKLTDLLDCVLIKNIFLGIFVVTLKVPICKEFA